MEYFIAVFKSRTQTMKFYDRLKKIGLEASVINTPRQASLGCGLSVKFLYRDLNLVKRLLTTENHHSFGGIFRVDGCGRTLNINRL